MCLPGTVETVREEIGAERGHGPASRGGRRSPARAPRRSRRCCPSRATADDDDHDDERGRRHADLTHVFTAGFPVYTGDAPTRRTLKTIATDGFYSQEWTFGEHSGTHVDAPGHFVDGGRLVTALLPDELFAPAAVIDISERVEDNPDAVVEVRDLSRFERRHGRIPRGALVFAYSGWEARLPDAAAFKNAGPDGAVPLPRVRHRRARVAARAARSRRHRRRHAEPGLRRLDDLRGAQAAARRGPLRHRSRRQPRGHPAARRARGGRGDPVGRGLGRSLPAAGDVLSGVAG